MRTEKREFNKIYSSCLCVFVVLFIFVAGCSKPLATAKVAKDIGFVSQSFAADTTEAFAAVRWSLKMNGYSIASENIPNGMITTTWIPSTSDSHAIDLFGRRDFGVNGAYYQLEVHIASENGRTRIDVGSRVKTLVANLKSTGIEERKVLAEVGNYLRTSEPELTNLGIGE